MPSDLPELIAAMTFFGVFALAPILYLLLRHQRVMAELIHKNATGATAEKVEALEREVRSLRAALLARGIESESSLASESVIEERTQDVSAP